MFCPKCSQQQSSESVRFCSRCGFPLGVVSEVLAGSGVLLAREAGGEGQALSPRREGLKQGAKMTLAGLVLTPLGYALCFVFHTAIPAVLPITLFLAGLAWMLYHRVFGETASPVQRRHRPAQLDTASHDFALPPAPGLNTAEIGQTLSVTEHTTNLLRNN
jgi:hypothetical protein